MREPAKSDGGDAARDGADFDENRITNWIPLQDVDKTNGFVHPSTAPLAGRA